jgi:hypothetical protein
MMIIDINIVFDHSISTNNNTSDYDIEYINSIDVLKNRKIKGTFLFFCFVYVCCYYFIFCLTRMWFMKNSSIDQSELIKVTSTRFVQLCFVLRCGSIVILLERIFFVAFVCFNVKTFEIWKRKENDYIEATRMQPLQ